MLRCLRMPLRAKIDNSKLPSLSLLRMQSTAAPADLSDEIIAKTNGAVRELALNRPKKLNAINLNMCELLIPRLLEYAKSDSAALIVVKGNGGKAFSAGGDVAALALNYRNEGVDAASKVTNKYFTTEFGLNHLIATYQKPYVAIIDGIVMGGGVGLSAHGPFRVASEKTLWAMPETTIGYYPDVGGLFFLSRMDGQLGLFLGLTSTRLKGYDAYQLGVATHYVPSDRVGALEQRLAELVPAEGTSATSDKYFTLIDRAISEFSADPPADWKPAFSIADRNTIDTCFAHDTVEGILSALDKDGSEFALKTKATLLEKSPTSLKVTLAAYRRFATQDIKTSLAEEQHLADNICSRPDFAEGVLALLVDKRKAKWDPATLEEVSESVVRDVFNKNPEHFAPMHFYNDRTFTQYPHHFALPSEEAVKLYVTGETSSLETKATREEVIKHFKRVTGDKQGLEVHIDEILARKTHPDSSDKTLLDWDY